MNRTVAFLTLLLGFATGKVYAQVDTEFWFAPPEVSSGHGDTPIYVRVSTLDEPATITVTQPARNNATLASATVPANSTHTFYLSHLVDYLETRIPATVMTTGLRVVSSAPVTAYYEVGATWNTDIFALKGRNALGNRFVIPGQNFYDNGSYSPAPSGSFDIVATQNNTVVKVRPTRTLTGHAGDTVITIKLNKGQTYSLRKATFLAAGNPIGSVVESNKPIAITLKDDSVINGGCRDLIGDQLVPTEVAGVEYVVIRGFLQSQEYFFTTATEDDTELFVSGESEPVATLNAGQVYRHPVTQAAVYVRADKPVYLLHVTGFGCEMGMAVLPSINCRGSDQIGFTRTTSEFFGLNILVRKEGIDHFSLNGSGALVPASAFSPVEGTADVWYAAQLSFDLGQVAVQQPAVITNDVESFQIGIINGDAATSCRYGYFSAFSTLFIGDDIAICDGESVVLSAGQDKESYLWNTGETSAEVSVSGAGDYWVRVERGNCVLYDTVKVEVETPHLDLGPDVEICPGEKSRVDGLENFSWDWSDGSTGRYLETDVAGNYSVVVHDYTGCVASDNVNVSFKTVPTVDLGDDVVKCPYDTARFALAIPGASFMWSGGQSSSSISVLHDGEYAVEVVYNGCVTRDTVRVTNLPGPPQDTIYGSPSVCPYAEAVTYSADPIAGSQYQWFVAGGDISGESGNVLEVDWAAAMPDARVGLVVFDSVGCRGDSLAFFVRINPELIAELPAGPDSLCLNNASDVVYSTPLTNGSVYTWNVIGGDIISGQGTEAVRVQWREGLNTMYLEESSTTIDTVCTGTSPTLEVLVYADHTTLTMDYVTVDTLNPSQGLIYWTLLADRESQPEVAVFRHGEGEDDFAEVARVAFGREYYADAYDYRSAVDYYVGTVNVCGELVVTDVHRTIALTGEADTATDMVQLGWSHYFGWEDGVDHYEIWRQLDHAPAFSFLADVGGTANTYSGPWVGDGFEHRYIVRAVSPTGKASWSNPVDFDFEHPVFIPNVFTPNSDEWNQRYIIRRIHLYPESLFVVSDRWGKKVFEKVGYKNDWDGAGLSTGVYYFYLRLGDNRPEYKGVIYLWR